MPTVALALTTAVGAGIAVAVLGVSAGPMLIAVIPATAGAVAGGTASLVLEPVSAAELMSRYPVPEAAGPVLVARLGFAPGLAMSGWLPLLAGRAAMGEGVLPGGGRVPVGDRRGRHLRPRRAGPVRPLRTQAGGARTVTPESDSPVLAVTGLLRRYATLVALGPIDLEVEAGEFVALVGPNGAGKSTLLACVAGLLEPTEGDVRVAGAAAGSLPARAATSYLGDEPVLYDDLSLEEHLEYVGRLHGVEDWERPAADLVTRLGLDERVDDLPAHFSKGMRQKTSIALGLARPFELLLADEPFDGLDPPSREVLTDLLDRSGGQRRGGHRLHPPPRHRRTGQPRHRPL